jgi:hypothetical protein
LWPRLFYRQVSHDLDIPVFSVLLDEHTGESGLHTRLEAFVEMLQVRSEVDNEKLLRYGNYYQTEYFTSFQALDKFSLLV